MPSPHLPNAPIREAVLEIRCQDLTFDPPRVGAFIDRHLSAR